MADPENHTLHLLREIRAAIGSVDTKVDRLEAKVDRNHAELTERIDQVVRAFAGDSVLGRYAAVQVEERLAALEQRLTALEQRG